VSKDSDQTETALRKFKLGPLGSLNQVTTTKTTTNSSIMSHWIKRDQSPSLRCACHVTEEGITSTLTA
jgi:hypothetical protein